MSHKTPRKTFWGWCRRCTWAIVARLIVLAAIALTLFRLAVALAPDYRADIEHLVGQVIGQRIVIGSLSAEWRGADPRLVLYDVQLGGTAKSPGLLLDRLTLSLDLIASVRHLELRPAELAAAGLTITVQRDRDGHFSVVGVGRRGLRSAAVEAMLNLLSQPVRLRLSDADVNYLDLANEKAYHLQHVNLLVTTWRGHRQLAGALNLPDELGRQASFIVRWPSRPARGWNQGAGRFVRAGRRA